MAAMAGWCLAAPDRILLHASPVETGAEQRHDLRGVQLGGPLPMACNARAVRILRHSLGPVAEVDPLARPCPGCPQKSRYVEKRDSRELLELAHRFHPG